MPFTCVYLPNWCAHRVYVDPGRRRPKRLRPLFPAVFCLVTLVGRGLGPRAHIGSAWSAIDRNLGVQARAVPACCMYVIDLIIKIPIIITAGRPARESSSRPLLLKLTIIS
jgi:hypothetical protein